MLIDVSQGCGVWGSLILFYYIINTFLDPKNLGSDTKIVFLNTLEAKICVVRQDMELSIKYGSHFFFFCF